MILAHKQPTVCHGLSGEDRKGVRLLSLRVSFDRMNHSAAAYTQLLQISSTAHAEDWCVRCPCFAGASTSFRLHNNTLVKQL